MNNHELQAKQILREREQNSCQYEKWKDDLEAQEKKSDGSNTAFSRQWKQYVFDPILEGIRKEIADPEFNRHGEATRAVERCLNIPLTYKKDRKTKEKIIKAAPEKNFFDLEVGLFMTLQMILDNALRPEMKDTIVDKVTGQDRVCYPAIDQSLLFKNVGERIELEIAFNLVQECFPRYFKTLDESCTGGEDDQPRSSSYYWRYNMTRALKRKAQSLHEQGRHEEAALYEWRPFGEDARFVGCWLVTRCLKYGLLQIDDGSAPFKLFQQVSRQVGPRSRKTFITLTEEAFKAKDKFIAKSEKFIQSNQPMLCPAASPDENTWGHWLLGQSLAKPLETKGRLHISADMIQYIKRLQKVPYKINQFVLDVMILLDKQNRGLKKFKPHCYVEPETVSQSLGLVGYHEDNT